jgi:hypothetical protein
MLSTRRRKVRQRASQAKELAGGAGWNRRAVLGSRPHERRIWRAIAQRSSASAQARASEREASRVGGLCLAADAVRQQQRRQRQPDGAGGIADQPKRQACWSFHRPRVSARLEGAGENPGEIHQLIFVQALKSLGSFLRRWSGFGWFRAVFARRPGSGRSPRSLRRQGSGPAGEARQLRPPQQNLLRPMVRLLARCRALDWAPACTGMRP